MAVAGLEGAMSVPHRLIFIRLDQLERPLEMRSFIPTLALTFCSVTSMTIAQETAAPQSDAGKVSYSIGTNLGGQIKRDGIELNAEQFLAGLTDAYEGKDLKLTPEEMMAVMNKFQEKTQAKMATAAAAEGGENLKAGQEFLAANGKKEGIVTTDSGLQYEILETGDGTKPTTEDKITAHYHGTLIDGTIFDSSVDRGEPASFPVSGVIKGWTEALQLMSVGSKWKLYLPSELAYGANPRPGGPIGPNAALIFEVQLLSID